MKVLFASIILLSTQAFGAVDTEALLSRFSKAKCEEIKARVGEFASVNEEKNRRSLKSPNDLLKLISLLESVSVNLTKEEFEALKDLSRKKPEVEKVEKLFNFVNYAGCGDIFQLKSWSMVIFTLADQKVSAKDRKAAIKSLYEYLKNKMNSDLLVISAQLTAFLTKQAVAEELIKSKPKYIFELASIHETLRRNQRDLTKEFDEFTKSISPKTGEFEIKSLGSKFGRFTELLSQEFSVVTTHNVNMSENFTHFSY